MKLVAVWFFTSLALILVDTSDKGPRTEPLNPKCREKCHKYDDKACGRQEDQPEGSNKTVTWYNSMCELRCDGAEEVDDKVCKDMEPKKVSEEERAKIIKQFQNGRK